MSKKKWFSNALIVGTLVVGNFAIADSTNQSPEKFVKAPDGVTDVDELFEKRTPRSVRERVRDELVVIRYGGSGQMESSIDRVRAWNRKSIKQLDMLRPRIARLLKTEEYALAYSNLREVLYGIRDSIRDYNAESGPYVSRFVIRGAQLFEKLDENIGEDDELATVTKINLILRFIDLIDIVDVDFDQKALPFVLKPSKDSKPKDKLDSKDFRQLQKGFIKLVQSQLQFLNSTFDRSRGLWSSVDPIGEPEVYLVAIQIMSYYAARDVANNLFAYENSAAVDDLESLREDILSGGEGRQGLGDVKDAYYYVVGQVHKIIKKLD
jgi:hypothetical protein